MTERPRLLSVLGVAFGLAVIVGNSIGAGILRTPGVVAEQLPSTALFFAAWIAGALYAFGGANAISELGTMMPHSGGQYHFARRALGPYAGFVVGWNDWISTSGTVTAVALVLAESGVILIPSLQGHERELAATVVIAFTVLIWRGVREGAVAQGITSSLKALVFLVLIAAAVVYAAGHGVAPAEPRAVPNGTALFAAFIISMQAVIYTFDGWTGAVYFSEELKDPARQIPRATFGGLIAVTAIYLLVNAAFALVVPITRMAGHELPAALVAQTVFGGSGDTVLRVIIVFVLLSAVNANLLLAPRVLFAMSRDRVAPAWASRVNPGGNPTAALTASAVIAILFLLTGTFDAAIAVLSFFFVATYTISFTAVFVLRKREPDASRPYRARGHPWTTGLMLIGSVAFLAGSIYSDPRNGLIAAALVALSYPVYRLLSNRVTE
jgi:APA family basic amino acid/polyamine antiporter